VAVIDSVSTSSNRYADEPLALCDQPANHRGAATERDQRDAVVGAPLDDGGDLVVAARSDHRVRGVGAVAGAQAQQVGRGLSASAVQPRRVVGEHVLVTDEVLELVQESVRQGRGQRHVGRLHRRCVAGADEGVDEAQCLRRERCGLGGVAPAGPVHLRRRR
jgi:hypothetical protein